MRETERGGGKYMGGWVVCADGWVGPPSVPHTLSLSPLPSAPFLFHATRQHPASLIAPPLSLSSLFSLPASLPPSLLPSLSFSDFGKSL